MKNKNLGAYDERPHSPTLLANDTGIEIAVESVGPGVFSVSVNGAPPVIVRTSPREFAFSDVREALKVCIEAIDSAHDEGTPGSLPAKNWHWFNRARALVFVSSLAHFAERGRRAADEPKTTSPENPHD